MAIDFTPTASVADLVKRVRAFIDGTVIPAEAEVGVDDHGPSSALLTRLRGAAAEAGVLAPTAPTRHGGLGLSHTEQAAVLEEAGRSLLGPAALNCAAPDEGNILLLDRTATDAQRERYLDPLARGRVRSCFAMTEPAPGAGSDPELLTTVARPAGGGDWVIDGRKWFITGADGAAYAIVMARTGDRAATMFLVDADNPGLTVTRRIETLDRSMAGGHCEVELTGCRVGGDAVLGAVGEGFGAAQVRLGPARLTHCMRWLGAARRAQEAALDYASRREIFGSRLGDLGLAQRLVADNEIDIAASRALILHATWLLDAGSPARQETSIAKTFVAEAAGRVVDRAVQLCGATGVSDDGPLLRLYREIRPFRIYDGPSESHRWSIARRTLRRHQASAA